MSAGPTANPSSAPFSASGSARPVPTLATRALGLGVWVLLAVTLIGSDRLIRYYFGSDILERPTVLVDRLQTVEALLARDSLDHRTKAVTLIGEILRDHPLQADAVLLLEQVRAAAPVGSRARADADKLAGEIAGELEKRVAKSPDDAETRFLLARQLLVPERAGSDPTRALGLLAEARGLLEKRVTAAPGDGAAAFLLARVLMSQTPPDPDAHRRRVLLCRTAGRPESELRLTHTPRVPIDVLLRRAQTALEKGLADELRETLRTVLTEDRDNPQARLMLVEQQLARRPNVDAFMADTDAGPMKELLAICGGARPPLRAMAYLAALEAGSPEEAARKQAMQRYAALGEAVAAGAKFDLIAEADVLVGVGQNGCAGLLLSAETQLGTAGSRRRAEALLRRAVLDLQAQRSGQPEDRADAERWLREALNQTPLAELPPAVLAFLASLEIAGSQEQAAVAPERYRSAEARGFDPVVEVERLAKLRLFGASRWLLWSLTVKGLGLRADPANAAAAARDAELWYQYGRTYASGGASDFETAVVQYQRAVEVGRAVKAPGAGKAALSIARVYANAGSLEQLREARELVALARACGIETMDITSAAKILSKIEENLATAARGKSASGARVAPH